MTFLQIHLALVMIIEDRMRENGQDPDDEPEPIQILETEADMAAFFGR